MSTIFTWPGRAKTKRLSIFIAILVFFSTYLLSQDNKVYTTVKIDAQEWMLENLNTDTFSNGDPIPHAKTAEEWEEAYWENKPAWCYYNSDPANGDKWGRLYNWFAVNDPRGLAPEGWRIPEDTDWDALKNNLIIGVAGKKTKSKEGWDNNGNGTNSSGFTGLPSGYRDFDGSFIGMGSQGYWWSSTDNGSKWISCRYLDSSDNYLHKHHMPKSGGLSVRCIK